MAELGLAASVLQITAFGVKVGSALWRCAKHIKNAKKDLVSIAREVEATTGVLNGVGVICNVSNTRTTHTAQLLSDTATLLDGCRQVFEELRKAVKAYDRDKAAGKYQFRFTSRFRWPISKARMVELQKLLERYKTLLSLMLNLLQIVESRQTATSAELQALEARLQGLILANQDLSQSNTSLSDTIATLVMGNGTLNSKALDQPNVKPLDLRTDDDGNQRELAPSLVSFERIKMQTVPADAGSHGLVTKRLQDCIDVVHGLASSLSAAMDGWLGEEHEQPSDIQDTYRKVTDVVGRLPFGLKCSQCDCFVTWDKLGSSHSALSHSCAGDERGSLAWWNLHGINVAHACRRQCEKEQSPRSRSKTLVHTGHEDYVNPTRPDPISLNERQERLSLHVRSGHQRLEEDAESTVKQGIGPPAFDLSAPAAEENKEDDGGWAGFSTSKTPKDEPKTDNIDSGWGGFGTSKKDRKKKGGFDFSLGYPAPAKETNAFDLSAPATEENNEDDELLTGGWGGFGTTSKKYQKKRKGALAGAKEESAPKPEPVVVVPEPEPEPAPEPAEQKKDGDLWGGFGLGEPEITQVTERMIEPAGKEPKLVSLRSASATKRRLDGDVSETPAVRALLSRWFDLESIRS